MIRREFAFAKLIGPHFRGVDMRDGRAMGRALQKACEALPEPNRSMLHRKLENYFRDPSDLDEQEGVKGITWSGIWGAFGMPVINIPEAKMAASLCMTRIPSEYIDSVVPPWPAMMIRVPEDLGLVIDGVSGLKNGEQVPCRLISVRRSWAANSKGEPWESWYVRLNGVLLDDGTAMIKRSTADAQALGFTEKMMMEDYGRDLDRSLNHSITVPIEQLCEPSEWGGPTGRSMEMACRLVAGACMAFSSGMARTQKSTGGALNKRQEKFPTSNQYLLRAPIKFNVTAGVRNYIANGKKGRGGLQSVQYVVRGHWKNQAHGSGRAERKFIHIEPYWRGPEDAPIAVRPHILKGPSDAP
jgi:hypothetical protein